MFIEQVKYLVVLLHAYLKNDTHQVKSLYCAANNQLRCVFTWCSTSLKNILLRAYCISMYAC